MKPLCLCLLAGCLITGNCQHAPPLYSLQSSDDPDSYRVFFSTMAHFRQLGATSGLIFLTTDRGREIYLEFPFSEAKCIANSSYCYITKRLPTVRSLDDCNYHVTLRGRKLRDHELCDPERCPNMDTPVNCHLSVAEKFVCQSTGTTASGGACNLPPELREFLPVVATARTGEVAEQTATDRDSNDRSRAILLGALKALAGVCLIAAVAMTTYWVIRSRIRRPKYVILLVNIDQEEMQAAGRDHWLRLPSKLDAEKVQMQPEYSLVAMANQGFIA